MRDFFSEDCVHDAPDREEFIAERIAIILEGCKGRVGLGQAKQIAESCWERYLKTQHTPARAEQGS